MLINNYNFCGKISNFADLIGYFSLPQIFNTLFHFNSSMAYKLTNSAAKYTFCFIVDQNYQKTTLEIHNNQKVKIFFIQFFKGGL
jgi:hypothetical protein